MSGLVGEPSTPLAGGAPVAASRCPACGLALAPALLACPSCRALVHGDELRRLAGVAADAAGAGYAARELASWRAALERLPAGSRQHAAITDRVEVLSRAIADGAPPPSSSLGVAAGPAADPSPVLPPLPTTDRAAAAGQPAAAGTATGTPAKRGWRGGVLAAIVALLWKLEAVLLFALGKAKLLLLGFSKLSTLGTMLLSFGIYWTAFGWPLALGLVLSIYVHEMGHVAALRRFGLAATWPMFIPGVGAVVRLKQRPATPQEDARVGLAGPIWGLAAAVAAWAAWRATGAPLLGAVARLGAWINLFNLLPIGWLDGGRGLRPLTRSERLAVAAVAGGLFAVFREPLLLFIAAIAGFAALRTGRGGGIGPPGDRVALAQYVGLLVVLAALAALRVL